MALLLIFGAACLLSGLQATSRLLMPYGKDKFPAAYGEAVDAYFSAEQSIRSGRYADASRTLKAYWKKFPKATTEIPQETGGIFTGHPPVYVALQMITRVADTLAARRPGTRETLRFTVLLPEASSGFDPANAQEARTNQGTPVTHRLAPEIVAARYRTVAEATWLFTEYLGALTAGDARFVTDFVPLRITVPVQNEGIAEGAISSRPSEAGYKLIWQSVPAAVRNRTDFWMIIFPSHKPSNDKLRGSLYFTGGGMGRGPDGSPVIVIDDQFLLRAQPHFNVGEKQFDAIERRLYLPQFLQHEFYHHLYLIYPEFGLEATSHQWHKRSAWPSDFSGSFESDYYEQSFDKRIQTATVPLISKMRFQAPSEMQWRNLTAENFTGTYRREPVENQWHQGSIVLLGTDLQWKNEAGAAWPLRWNKQGDLITGEGNPYYQSEPVYGRSFKVRLKRDATGKFTQQVEGFMFNNELYRRVD